MCHVGDVMVIIFSCIFGMCVFRWRWVTCEPEDVWVRLQCDLEVSVEPVGHSVGTVDQVDTVDMVDMVGMSQCVCGRCIRSTLVRCTMRVRTK